MIAGGRPAAHAAALPAPPVPAAVLASMTDVYRQRMHAAVSRVRVAWVVLTPEYAQAVLDACNDGNRALKQAWRRLAGALRRNAFQVNCETIVFDWHGRLRNGQHRLKAVVSAGVPVLALVCWGVDPEAFATFDSHAKRSAGDVLGICGYRNAKNLATALSWQLAYEGGYVEGRVAIANDQALMLAERHPELSNAVLAVSGQYNSRGVIPAGLACFLYYQFADRSPQLCEQFFDRVVKVIGVPAQCHERVLRDRLASGLRRRGEDAEDHAPPPARKTNLMRKKKARSHLTELDIAALCIKTWNRVRRNDPYTATLAWKATEPFPETV